MNFFKTAFFSGIATLIRIISAFILNKVVAVYLGPSGIAFIGQFTNFINLLTPFSNAGISSGLVKYIAENKENENEKRYFISSALYISILFPIILSFLLFFTSEKISLLLFNSYKFSNLILLFSFSLFFTSLFQTITGILNGLKEIKILSLSSSIANILSLFLSIYLVRNFSLNGALISYILVPIISFMVVIIYLIISKPIKNLYNYNSYKKEKVKRLLSFTLMGLTTAITSNISQIVIRNYVISHLSLNDAGYWQSINKISDLYLMFITATFSVYYLPKLSEIKEEKEISLEIKKMYLRIIPALILVNLGIYFFREHLIRIIFTEKFLNMQSLFAFQLIGDLFKISSWLLSFVFLAKAMTKIFIFTEIFYTIIYVLACIVFVNVFSLVGLSYAYCLSYLIYQFMLLIIFRKLVFRNKF